MKTIIVIFANLTSIIITIIILMILLACKPFSKNTLKDKNFETHY